MNESKACNARENRVIIPQKLCTRKKPIKKGESEKEKERNGMNRSDSVREPVRKEEKEC